MEPALEAAYKKLLAIREREDLTLKPTPLLRKTIKTLDGSEKPLKPRYYQVQMVLHLLAMKRFIVGDDTGLGKCQPYSSLVLTDQGLLPMGEIEDWSDMEPDTFKPMRRKVHVLVDGEKLPVKSYYYGGVKPTVTATTRYGFVNTGSRVHPVLVLRGGRHEWVQSQDLQEGDYLCVERREMAFPENEPVLVQTPGAPRERMSPDLARFLGYYIGEGSLTYPSAVVVSQCPHANPEIHEDINRLMVNVLGNAPKHPDSPDLRVNNTNLRRWLAANGLDYTLPKSREIPSCIFQASRESCREFLRALFEGEGHVSSSHIEYSTASETLGKQVQIMLLRFGIVANRSPKTVKGRDHTYWRLTLCGRDAEVFQSKIGFISTRKKNALAICLERPRSTNHDVVPETRWIFEKVREDLKSSTAQTGANGIRKGSGLKQFGVSFVNTLNNIRNYGHNPSYDFIERVVGVLREHAPESEALSFLTNLVETRYFYDPVVSLEEGEEEVFDIEVDDPRHCFVSNGLVNHNTFEAIAALCYLWQMNPDQKVIVLTKKSAVPQWVKEFAKFTTGIKTVMVKGSPKKRQKLYDEWEASEGPTVMVAGYSSIKRDIARIMDWEGYVLVCDEATVFKNPKTQVHQVCKHMAQQADRVWGLTATLIKNNLIEGFGIYKVVVPSLFGHTQNSFMRDYCIIRMQRVRGNRQIPVIVGYRQSDIERFKLKIDPYYLGRPKHEVAKELPVLTTKDIEVGMNRFQSQKYQEALAGLLELGSGEEKETDKLTSIIYCQQIANHPALIEYEDSKSEKLDALVDMLTEGGDFDGEKVIIFSRFKKMVDFAIPVLEKKGVKCVRVTGSEDEDERAEAMETFQDPESDTNVIWITMAGGDAINLQMAKALIFYDTPWSAGDYLQCLDAETEILTPDGFKRRGEISVGDDVAAFDPHTSEITWSPVRSVVDRPLGSGEIMFGMQSRHMNMRVTGGHRMLFRRKTYQDKKAVWPSEWRFETAKEMASEKSHYQVPACGMQEAPGLPLTDTQLEFLGWYLADGHLNTSNAQIVISQALHQPQIEDLRRCIRKCGFDWSEYDRDPNACGGFPNGKPQVVFSIPKGTEGGTRTRSGWVDLADYLDKDFSPLFEGLTGDQLGHLLRGLHLGDGSKYRGDDWTQRSYHIYTSNRTFADRLQSLCVRRGYRCNLSVRPADPTKNRKEGYTLHIKQTKFWSLCGWSGDTQRPNFSPVPTEAGEQVWCVENDMGTLVTRRRGKVVVMGNCLGRMIRIGSPNDRVYAVHLIAEGTVDERVQEVLKKKMSLVEAILGKRLVGEGDDLEDATFEVEGDITKLFNALREDAQKILSVK